MDDDDGQCLECSHVLTEDEKIRDQCARCGRHWHDDLEDYDGEEE